MAADTIKITDKGNVKIIAHRGLSGLERQNTNSAFVAAGNRSYFGIETDIHVTADGEFAVIHDESTGSVAKQDVNVEKSSFKELTDIILNNTDSTVRTDLRIPRLCEYISICKKYGKTAVLELKNPFKRADIEKAVGEIKKLDYIDGVIFISFALENLIVLRELLPGAKIQYLFDRMSEDVFDTLKKYRFDVDVYYDLASREFVDKVHSLGLEVNVWTVDKPEVAQHVIANGVDYITTNILE